MTGIKLVAILKKESSSEHSETLFSKKLNYTTLVYRSYIIPKYIKKKLRNEQTASSRMRKRLKFWDNWCSFPSGGLG